jgi:hypothetical protein
MTKKRRRIDKAAWEVTIDRLRTDLTKERRDHARTRNELQAEIERIWRLVPGYKISLMGVYPPLRRLFHVLAEAADLQDPSRGAAYEDTMRTEYTPDGETLTQTERAVLTHRKHRADVTEMNKRLTHLADDLARLISASQSEYNPPDGECAECGRALFQTDTGRRKTYCSVKCRRNAATKRDETKSVASR